MVCSLHVEKYGSSYNYKLSQKMKRQIEKKPPLIIDSAKVLKYAIVDDSVEFTDRLCLYVGMPGELQRLGKVPKLAICQNYKAKDYLLLFCDNNWKTLGVAGANSIAEIKRDAEKAYKGISKKWVTVARPNVFRNWPGDLGPICSFCGKTLFEGLMGIFPGKNAYICNECVIKFYDIHKANEREA